MKPILPLSIATVLLFLSFSLQRPFVPLFMEEDLKASITEIGQAAAVLGLMGLFVAVPAGLLSDRIGRQIPAALGALIWGAALALVAVASEPYQVVLSYLLAGIGTVLFDASLTALVGDISPKEELGRSYGIYNAAVQMGFAVGPVAGAFFILASGYRDVFLAVAVLPAAAATLVLVSRPKNTIIQAIDPVDPAAERERIHRSEAIWAGWISTFSFGVLAAGISVLAPLYARLNSFDDFFIGMLFTIQSVTGAFGLFTFARRLDASRHVGLLTAGGLLLTGLSTAGFALSTSGIWLLLMMGLFGVGGALTFMSASVGIARGTNVANRGAAMGSVSMSRYAGFMFGPWVGSIIVSSQSSIAAGYEYGFFALAAISFAGTLLIILLSRIHQ
ncbi:MAG: MFS transporter [Thaumarchaeota archaeon]|nr:MFS transporter [Nitrososphaerota archaeon]MCL5318036.1 MFS transporter [Nitrososphaerota archaeon]